MQSLSEQLLRLSQG
ncbi:TPA: hypothetical protein ACWR4W_005099 [Escherichia coli]|nr:MULTISPECIES: hypothetical protein [Enterobacteriaceae]MCZ5911011.1 hypothetical protein [Escherichia coli]MCZ5911019.1 hypothetical protein [Escherichia coli]